MLNRKTLVYHEIIGLKVKIISHSDPTLVDRSGTVLDETMNTLVILDNDKGKRIRVPKLYGIFEFELPSGERVVVDGILIHGRPEDRLKKMLRR